MLLAATIFFGCGPNDRDILKKYEGYTPITPSTNQAGINIENFFGLTNKVFQVTYTSPLLKEDAENVRLLSERFIALNAENPADTLPIEVSVGEQSFTNYSRSGEITAAGKNYFTIIGLGETKAKYVIVGFKGIDGSESDKLATLPCFFIVSLKKNNSHVLTTTPMLAGNHLFDASHTFTRFYCYEGVLDADNNLFHIRIGEIGTNEDGNTFVDFLSKEIKKDEWESARQSVNAWETSIGEFLTEIVVNGKMVYPIKYGVGDGIVRHIYNTKKMPESIKVKYSGVFSDENHIVFDGKTKAVLHSTRN
jgi:hypothetical protein